MWPQRVWFSWFILLPFTSGMDNTAITKQSHGSRTLISAQDDADRWLDPRQVPPSVTPNPTTTSSTYDFWWPFPAPTTPTPATPTASAATPLIIFSIVPDSSFVPDTAVSSSTTMTSISLSSTSGSSASQSASSTSTSASAAVSTSPFSFIDLIPVLAAVGVFLLGIGIWLLYGCCTRRPRARIDDGELICGPPYPGHNESDARRDIEERGQEEEEEMLHIPKYGRRKISGQYRWPSFSEPPPFDPVKGFYVPNQYRGDDKDRYFTATLIAPQATNSRSKSSRTQRSSRSKRSAVAGPSRSRSSPSSPCSGSDSTSIALLELYESDEEEVVHRKAKETPWESLRHKSIKRGILEQVKKENNWMDSIRSSIQRGSAFLPGRGYTGAEEEPMLPIDDDTGARTREAQRHIGRRRGHVKVDSDLFIDPAPATFAVKSTSDPSGFVAADIKPLKVSKSKAAPDSGVSRPGVRRGFTWLKDDPSDVDRFTPLPTRVTEGRSRSRSQSRSRSSSPVKVRSNNTSDGTTLGASDAIPISRDILPRSPCQIMSPPLESQMCFTPISLSTKKVPTTPTRAKSRSRSRVGASPTKIPTPRNGKRLHTQGVPLPHPDNSRGRPMKKRTGPDFFKPPKPSRNKNLTTHPPPMVNEPEAESSSAADLASAGARGRLEGAEAMKKVDRIVETSWGARDLGEEGIRCLSPSGFGRQV